MRQPVTQGSTRNPLKCALCAKHNRPEAATWLVTAKVGGHNIAACDAHVEILERLGVLALKPPPKGRKHQI